MAQVFPTRINDARKPASPNRRKLDTESVLRADSSMNSEVSKIFYFTVIVALSSIFLAVTVQLKGEALLRDASAVTSSDLPQYSAVGVLMVSESIRPEKRSTDLQWKFTTGNNGLTGSTLLRPLVRQAK